MTELALHLDNKAQKLLKELKAHYKVNNNAEIFSKALAVLKVVAHVQQTEGEIFARKGTSETKIIVT